MRQGIHFTIIWSLGVPECNAQHGRVLHVEMGRSVEVYCNVSFHPGSGPISYQWTLKRSGHLRDLVAANGSSSSSPWLLYEVRGVTDYGSLQCKGSNSAGTQLNPCTFIIKPTGRPIDYDRY